MYYTPLINNALKLSFSLHRNQSDKSGVPYVYHPYAVAEIACRSIFPDAEGKISEPDEYVICAALLHDSIEDCGVDEGFLIEYGIPAPVADAVRALTHPEGVEYLDYVRKIKDNPIAAKVKYADLTHNSDLSRIDLSDDEARKKAEKRIEKYRKALKILSGEEI